MVGGRRIFVIEEQTDKKADKTSFVGPKLSKKYSVNNWQLAKGVDFILPSLTSLGR